MRQQGCLYSCPCLTPLAVFGPQRHLLILITHLSRITKMLPWDARSRYKRILLPGLPKIYQQRATANPAPCPVFQGWRRSWGHAAGPGWVSAQAGQAWAKGNFPASSASYSPKPEPKSIAVVGTLERCAGADSCFSRAAWENPQNFP